MENPPFWWYLPGKIRIFRGYVSLREGTPLKLTFRPCKLMVGRWIFLLGWPIFRGELLVLGRVATHDWFRGHAHSFNLIFYTLNTHSSGTSIIWRCISSWKWWTCLRMSCLFRGFVTQGHVFLDGFCTDIGSEGRNWSLEDRLGLL